MSGSAAVPVFVVVGNVNQGKSSIVAALAEDPTVPMAPMPGTTVRSGEYHFRVDGKTLFTLVDTPGFQDARHALAWLRERSRSPTDRPGVVADFVAAHAEGERFQDEVRLLKPVLAGASVLYVVDASGPPQPSNEAEMEVLRWTGQPRMALLNRTRGRDFAAEWRPWLEQYFNVVRTFNAHEAGFEERMNLLRGFRELREDWRKPLEATVAAMEAERASRERRAAAIVAEFLVKALAHVERRRIEGEGEPLPSVRADLQKAFEERLRGFEAEARLEVERLFRHESLERREAVLPVAAADLFSDASWRLFGLTRVQLARYGVAWGAALGAAIDLMVGGLSFLAGTAIGAAAGGLAGFFGGTQVARTWGERSRLMKVLFPGETGRFLAIGPVTNPQFAWILLDRAMAHLRAVSARSHARQDSLDLSRGVAASLPAPVRDALDAALRGILRAALRGTTPATERAQLTALLQSPGTVP